MIELMCKKCDDVVACDEGTIAVMCSMCSMIDVPSMIDVEVESNLLEVE